MTEPLALIIEDDLNLLTIFTEAIRRAGYAVKAVQTGEEAIAALFNGVDGAERPDLIVLDFHLPGVSGVEVLNRIRATPALARTALVLATADPVLGDQYHGDSDYLLVKPVSYHVLRELAEKLAARH